MALSTLDSGAQAEQPRLSSGYLYLCAVAKLRMQPATVADLDAPDEVEIQDLLAVRTKEASRIEPRFDRCQGAIEQRMGLAPMQPDGVVLRLDERHFVE